VWAAVLSQVTVQLSSGELFAASVPVLRGTLSDLTEAGKQALLRDRSRTFKAQLTRPGEHRAGARRAIFANLYSQATLKSARQRSLPRGMK
jgi:hypothetical protein